MEVSKTDNFFEDLVSKYIFELENLYLQKIEQSDNKKYASAFYRSSIFERNPKIPKESIFFNFLSRIFLHHYRLNRHSALDETFGKLPDIKFKTEVEIVLLEEMYEEDTNDSFHFLSDRIGNEQYLMSLEYHELTDLLAFFLAIKSLLEKYPKSEEIEPFSLNAPISEMEKGALNRKHEYSVTFSDKQQALALYFLMEHIGITPRADVNMTDVARFLHLLSNQPITVLDNSAKYGILKKMFNGKSDKAYLKDLETILPYFQKLQLDKAQRMIQEEIKEIKENLK
ncbi:hypothetical protein G5B10_14900 [Fluviicola sp. SGL-29]|nr:hypothetical protein [Fluviicola sp. SGL-29]